MRNSIFEKRTNKAVILNNCVSNCRSSVEFLSTIVDQQKIKIPLNSNTICVVCGFFSSCVLSFCRLFLLSIHHHFKTPFVLEIIGIKCEAVQTFQAQARPVCLVAFMPDFFFLSFILFYLCVCLFLFMLCFCCCCCFWGCCFHSFGFSFSGGGGGGGGGEVFWFGLVLVLFCLFVFVFRRLECPWDVWQHCYTILLSRWPCVLSLINLLMASHYDRTLYYIHYHCLHTSTITTVATANTSTATAPAAAGTITFTHAYTHACTRTHTEVTNRR